MAAPRLWTDREIERFREANGLVPADSLAAEFRCCRSCVLDQERRLGICRPKREVLGRKRVNQSRYHPLPPFPRDWQPLPAGHPETWGLLTRGTVLDGTAWPDQVVSL